jgi:hypothetical protein
VAEHHAIDPVELSRPSKRPSATDANGETRSARANSCGRRAGHVVSIIRKLGVRTRAQTWPAAESLGLSAHGR